MGIDKSCTDCTARICARELLMSRVLGYRQRPLCHRCLAIRAKLPEQLVVKRVQQYLRLRSCLYRQWLKVRHCAPEGNKPCCPASLGE